MYSLSNSNRVITRHLEFTFGVSFGHNDLFSVVAIYSPTKCRECIPTGSWVVAFCGKNQNGSIRHVLVDRKLHIKFRLDHISYDLNISQMSHNVYSPPPIFLPFWPLKVIFNWQDHQKELLWPKTRALKSVWRHDQEDTMRRLPKSYKKGSPGCSLRTRHLSDLYEIWRMGWSRNLPEVFVNFI